MDTVHTDVLIVGAGISGISAAYYLQKDLPEKGFQILEQRERIGGTWDLFQYPGIRSDSDMYTLGFRFKPWTEQKAIADGPSIFKYVNETARENGIDEKIRFGVKVKAAHWSSDDALWTVTAEEVETGKTRTFTTRFLFMCAGYYNYDEGYTPDYPGRDQFQGEFIHPQHWPKDLAYRDKKVVVIGSGATAVTLVPELAKEASEVTMLQRSPTYMGARPAEDAVANGLRKVLPSKVAYSVIRWRNVLMQMLFFKLARSRPEKIKDRMIKLVREQLPEDYDVETHFTPRYNPWDERVCLVPDGDMFEAISEGRAKVVTDQIETFTDNGIKLQSGEVLDADIIVSATGLNLQMLGGMDVQVDGRKMESGEVMLYKGMMYSDVPNLAATFGYTNASWTLKADLTSEYVVRLLKHMDQTGAVQATPRFRTPDMETRPFVDFSSGYFKRVEHLLPKQGAEKPWRLNQNYALDIAALRFSKVDDGVMEFRKPGEAVVTSETSDEVAVAAE